MTIKDKVLLVAGDAIARYGFPDGHAFGPDRHEVFMTELRKANLESSLMHASPRAATMDELQLFHTPAHVQRVMELSRTGQGLIDNGDTPAYKGVFEAAINVVGATLTAVEYIMNAQVKRAFVPIAGLHHAARDHAAGFCVFNDIGVAIE